VLASGLGAVLNSTRASQSFARVFLVSQKCAGLGRPGPGCAQSFQRASKDWAHDRDVFLVSQKCAGAMRQELLSSSGGRQSCRECGVSNRDSRPSLRAVDLHVGIKLFSECLNQVRPQPNPRCTAPSLGKTYPVV
jgi:hypothetical protein